MKNVHSRDLDVEVMKQKNWSKTNLREQCKLDLSRKAKCQFISVFGVPKIIRSDQAICFMSELNYLVTTPNKRKVTKIFQTREENLVMVGGVTAPFDSCLCCPFLF